MKTLKYKLLIIIGILSFSCDIIDPIDDLDPLYKITEDLVFENSDRVEAALNGIYFQQSTNISVYQYLGGLFYPQWETGLGFETNEVVTTNNQLSYDYTNQYAIIQSVNLLVSGLQSIEVPALTEERSIEIQGEAYLHRAIAHFHLLRYFGQFYDLNSSLGVVISTEPIRENKPYPRATVQQSYDAIISDLDFAIANAPNNHTIGRLSKTTAKAYKAKVLMYMQNWEEAASLALEIINSNVYQLMPDFRDIYNEGYNSAENIFSPITLIPTYFDLGAGYYSYADTRLISIADASVGTDSDGDLATGSGFDPRFAFARATNTLVGSSTNKYPFNQFNSTSGQQTNAPFKLRLAEMYFIYAEAKTRMSNGTTVDTDALSKLNAIRVRAGLLDATPANKEELLEAIRIEKILELNDENNEPWFDLIRYHIFGDINAFSIRPTLNSTDQFIMPIPDQVLTGNSALTPNPGYQ